MKRKTATASEILDAAILLQKARDLTHDALMSLSGKLPESALSTIWRHDNKCWGAVHSLESAWVRAIARELGCPEHCVPFHSPAAAKEFFDRARAGRVADVEPAG